MNKMKNYDEYLEDYKKAIEPGLQKNDGYIIKESVYISMRWQEENNWNPWDKYARVRLEALKLFDIRLYQAVVEGIQIVAKLSK